MYAVPRAVCPPLPTQHRCTVRWGNHSVDEYVYLLRTFSATAARCLSCRDSLSPSNHTRQSSLQPCNIGVFRLRSCEIEGGSVPCDHGVCHQPLAHGKARRMPPELASDPGGKASLRVNLRPCSCSSAPSAASRRARVTLDTYSRGRPRQRSACGLRADCVRCLLGPPGSALPSVKPRPEPSGQPREGLHGAALPRRRELRSHF